MQTPLHRCTKSFIVRIWAEYLEHQPQSWRGILEICDQGEEIPFMNLEDLVALIREKSLNQTKMEVGK
jgi:hypothetical protein